MEAKITFKNGAEMTAEKNGDCLIVAAKPTFPADMSLVTVECEDGSQEYHNAEVVECASIDGRYWFAFVEAQPTTAERLDEIEAAMIELAGMIGGME